MNQIWTAVGRLNRNQALSEEFKAAATLRMIQGNPCFYTRLIQTGEVLMACTDSLAEATVLFDKVGPHTDVVPEDHWMYTHAGEPRLVKESNGPQPGAGPQ